MKKIRAAVVGCGAIAHHCHIPGYQKIRNCEVVAVVDPSDKNRKLAQKDFGIANGYKDIDSMLKAESPDVVSVCSPNRFHAEQSMAALKHGCHVLCEKPLCLTTKEAGVLKRTAQKAGTIFMVAFTHRLYRGNMKAKKALDKGEIGKPFMIRVRFAHQGPDTGWMMSNSFFTPSMAGGGALFDMGIHAIDIASYFMGKIKKVSGMIGTLAKKIEVEDNAIMQFTFENGALGYAEAGWTTKQGFFGIEIYGSEGCIVIDYNHNAYRITGTTSASGKRNSKTKILDKTPIVGGWDIELDHFIRCVRKNEQPEMDIDAGIDSLRVAIAAYESHRKGKIVTL